MTATGARRARSRHERAAVARARGSPRRRAASRSTATTAPGSRHCAPPRDRHRARGVRPPRASVRPATSAPSPASHRSRSPIRSALAALQRPRAPRPPDDGVHGAARSRRGWPRRSRTTRTSGPRCSTRSSRRRTARRSRATCARCGRTSWRCAGVRLHLTVTPRAGRTRRCRRDRPDLTLRLEAGERTGSVTPRVGRERRGSGADAGRAACGEGGAEPVGGVGRATRAWRPGRRSRRRGRARRRSAPRGGGCAGTSRPAMIRPIRAGANASICAAPISCATPIRWAFVVGREVDPVVDLGARHHERVTGPQRRDREERDAHVVAPDERAGQLAVDDAGEDRGHRPSLSGGRSGCRAAGRCPPTATPVPTPSATATSVRATVGSSRLGIHACDSTGRSAKPPATAVNSPAMISSGAAEYTDRRASHTKATSDGGRPRRSTAGSRRPDRPRRRSRTASCPRGARDSATASTASATRSTGRARDGRAPPSDHEGEHARRARTTGRRRAVGSSRTVPAIAPSRSRRR